MRGIMCATFATLLLVTSGMMGSGHTALAHKVIGTFSNFGNYQETQQSCGNSCIVSSSNVITQGQGSRTALPPMGTDLSLAVKNVTNGLSLRSDLTFSANGQIVIAQVPITITFTGTGVPPNLTATAQEGFLATFGSEFSHPLL